MMQSFCTHCGSALSPGAAECAQCRAALAPAATRIDPRQWGIWPPALGLMVLVPTAVLIASLALVIPLAIAAVLSATALGLLQVALVWLFGIRTWPPPWALVGFTRPRTSLRHSAMLAVAALVCSLGFAQLYTMAALALGWNFLMPPEIPDGLLLPGGWVVFSALALAVWTPIAEETFFRGFILRGFTNRWRLIPALVASAAVFAALHLAPALLLPVFVTGLLLGWLYHRTGSLWPCIAVHAAQNLVAVLSAWFGL
ncbi:MAG: CPBP family glutamic-type intramembrane protease [Chloroflexota bacterium]|nr:CPBP family glutamic-type intramembrane protease [Chloroflexota bacterium]MDE2961902.1 CPBP family glutamic-type intramembrane protease [Chloroflexota bacterium]